MDGAVFTFYLEVRWSKKLSERDFFKRRSDGTHILESLAESCPKDVSAGRIDVSSHCLLKDALAFQLLGVVEGAGGYNTDEVAATDDVAATCRGCNLPF